MSRKLSDTIVTGAPDMLAIAIPVEIVIYIKARGTATIILAISA
jgi:hypothetical protein